MKILRWLDRYLEEAILVIFLILITAVMFFQIIMRFAFHSPLPWPEEFCRYCFVMSAMLATGFCIRNNKMLCVDVVIQLFPRSVTIVLDVLAKLLAVAFCLVMLGASWQVTMRTQAIGQVSPALEFPTWILYASAPLGFFLGAFRGLQSIWFAIRNERGKKGEEV